MEIFLFFCYSGTLPHHNNNNTLALSKLHLNKANGFIIFKWFQILYVFLFIQVPKATPATATKPAPAATPAPAANQTTTGRKGQIPPTLHRKRRRDANMLKCLFFFLCHCGIDLRGDEHHSTQSYNRNTSCCSSAAPVVGLVGRICCFFCLRSVSANKVRSFWTWVLHFPEALGSILFIAMSADCFMSKKTINKNMFLLQPCLKCFHLFFFSIGLSQRAFWNVWPNKR